MSRSTAPPPFASLPPDARITAKLPPQNDADIWAATYPGNGGSDAAHAESWHRRLEEMAVTLRMLSNADTVHAFASRFLTALGRFFDVEGGSIYLVLENELRLTHSLDPGHAPDAIPFPLREGAILHRALDRNLPVLITGSKELQEFYESGWTGYRDDSALVLPLNQERGSVIALVSLHGKKSGAFDEQDKLFGTIFSAFGCEALRAVYAKEALRRSEHRYSQLARKLNSVVMSITPKGDLNYCSASMMDFGGYMPDEEIGEHITKYFASRDDGFVCYEFIERICETGRSGSVVFMFLASDGIAFEVEMLAKPILRDNHVFAIECTLRHTETA